MGVFDSYLAENRFLGEAGKCKTDSDRINFCRKFLQDKGLYPDELYKNPTAKIKDDPPVSTTRYDSPFSTTDTEKVRCYHKIDQWRLERMDTDERTKYNDLIFQYLSKQLIQVLYEEGRIKISMSKDLPLMQTVYCAELEVKRK